MLSLPATWALLFLKLTSVAMADTTVGMREPRKRRITEKRRQQGREAQRKYRSSLNRSLLGKVSLTGTQETSNEHCRSMQVE
jgi:hypothetical protein